MPSNGAFVKIHKRGRMYRKCALSVSSCFLVVLHSERARFYEGSRRWWQGLTFSAHTVVAWDETCNQFVYDVLKEVGAAPPKLFRPGTLRAKLYQFWLDKLFYETPPVSHEWADPNFYIPNWDVVPGGSSAAQPGMLFPSSIRMEAVIPASLSVRTRQHRHLQWV